MGRGPISKKIPFQPTLMIMNHKINQDKRLVNGAMDSITEIIWPLFRRILAVKIDFGKTGVHQINAMTVQFLAKFCCGTAEQRMLP
jgi:hypothetical protein